MTQNKIIFIVGNSRSGTTMLGRIFGTHSQVNTFGELHFFEQMVDSESVHQKQVWDEAKLLHMLERLLTSIREDLFAPVCKGKYLQDAQKILDLCDKRDPVSVYECCLREETRKQGKSIPCEQTPRYLYAAEVILGSFPESYIINLVRDPRDVLLSQKNKWRRRFLGAKNIPLHEAFRAWVNYHPFTIAKLWSSSVREAQSLEEHPRFMSLRFEDLLNNPEKYVQVLCTFVGISYETNMLDVPQVGSSTGIDNPNKFGIDSAKASGWQKRGGISQVELSICQKVSDHEMQSMGYKKTPVSTFIVYEWLSMVLFVLKISLALLLNIKRSKNMIASIRRRLIKPKKKVV